MFKKNHFYNIHNQKSIINKSLVCLIALACLTISSGTLNNHIITSNVHARTHIVLLRVHHHRRVHHHHHFHHHNRRHNRGYVRVHHLHFLNDGYISHHFIKKQRRAFHRELVRQHRRISRRHAIKRDGNNPFAKRTAHDIYRDINHIRHQDGLRTLPIDTAIQKVADIRNGQVNYAYTHYNNYRRYPISRKNNNPSDNWIHGVDTRETDDDDASRLGIEDTEGTAEYAGDIYVNGVTHYDHGHRNYNVTNPDSAAYANIDNMVNDDAYSNWGHRTNILDREATGIGVASYYNPKTRYLTDVEDFSYGQNPKDI